MNIGTRKLNTGLGGAGVGWAIVPDMSLREEYIADCYRTQTIAIHGGQGYGIFQSVHIPANVLQDVVFPTEKDERGTTLIWVKDAMTQLPVIVNSLNLEGEFTQYGEGQTHYKKTTGDNVIDLFIDSNQADVTLNIVGDIENPAHFKLKVKSENNDSQLEISTDNNLSVYTDNEINVTSRNIAKLEIIGEDAKVLTRVTADTEKVETEIVRDDLVIVDMIADEDHVQTTITRNDNVTTVLADHDKTQTTITRSGVDVTQITTDENEIRSEKKVGNNIVTSVVQDDTKVQTQISEEGEVLTDVLLDGTQADIKIIRDDVVVAEVKINEETVYAVKTVGEDEVTRVALDDEQIVANIIRGGDVKSGVTIDEGGVKIIADKLGQNDAGEAQVLGNTLVGVLRDILTQINAITVPTALGPSGIPNNSAAFTGISNTIEKILSEKSFLE